MSKKLIDSEESDVDHILNINQDYVKSYENFRSKEVLQKLKDKYKDNILSDDEIDYESDEDDENEESDVVDEECQIFDQKFFKVYGALKRKDSAIYEKNYSIFNEIDDKNNESKFNNKNDDDQEVDIKNDEHNKLKTSQGKAIRLLEYHKKLIKEKKGITDEDELPFQKKDKGQSYYQELDAIKRNFKTILEQESDDEDLIKGHKSVIKKKKNLSANEILKIGSKNDEDISFLKKYWNNKQLDEKEKFLKDYIINKKYLSQNLSTVTFKEEKYMSDDQKIFSKNTNDNSDDNDKDDDEDNDDVNKFDDKNKVDSKDLQTAKHRFQESDSFFIKRFPRSFNSIRETVIGTARAVKRSELRERKKKEKKEELQKYREFKRAEIRQKLKKLENVSLNQRLIEDLDVDLLVDETDFDPAKYDAKMSELFGDGYYDMKVDIKKPIFDKIPGIDDDIEEIAGLEFLRDDDDDDDDDDDNGDDNGDDDDQLNKKELRKEKNEDDLDVQKTIFKKIKNKKKIRKDKINILEKKNIGIYEDLIGDLPTRFKYRKVLSNDFGLTPGELILSDDKDLNRWASLKKTCQYRSKQEEDQDIKAYSRKASDYALKKKILKSLYDENKAAILKTVIEDNEPRKKKKRAKKRKKHKQQCSDFKIDTQTSIETDSKFESRPNFEPHHKFDKPEHFGKLNNDKEHQQNSNQTKNEKKNSRTNRYKKRKQKRKTNQAVDFDRLKAYGLSNREIKKSKLM